MDRNTITGLLLIGAILIGYSWWMQPSEEEIEAQRRKQEEAAAAAQVEMQETNEDEAPVAQVDDSASSETIALDSAAKALQDSLDKIQKKQRFGSFADAANGSEELFTIQNDLVKLTLSNKGAAPVIGELKEYVTHDSMPLLLFDKETSSFNFTNA